MAQDKDELTAGRTGESEETRKRRGRLNMIAGVLTGKHGDEENETKLSSPTQGEVVDMLTMDSEENDGDDVKPKARGKSKPKADKRAKAKRKTGNPKPSDKRAAREAEVRAAEEAEAAALAAASMQAIVPEVDGEDEAEAEVAEVVARAYEEQVESEDAAAPKHAKEDVRAADEPEAEEAPAEEPAEAEAPKKRATKSRAKRTSAKTRKSAVAEEAADAAVIAASVAEIEPAEEAAAEEAAKAAEEAAPKAAKATRKTKAAKTDKTTKTTKTTRRTRKAGAEEAEAAAAAEAADDADKTRVAAAATAGAAASAAVSSTSSTLGDDEAIEAFVTGDEAMEADARAAYESLERRQRSRRRRRIWIGLALIAALALGAWYLMNNMMGPTEEPAPEVSTGMVYRGEFVDKVASSGSTEPMDSVVVTPEIDGIITEVKVAEGNYVNEGDEVLVIKNDELDRTIEEASRNLQAAQSAISQAQANADAAYNAYTTAWNAANEAGDFSGFDQEGLQAAYSAALGEVQAAENAAATAQSAYDTAIKESQKRSVKAPRSGSVIAVNAVVGGGVGSAAAGTTSTGPLIQIADLSQMKVTVQVNEVDVSNIRPGQRGTATFSALPGVSTSVIVERIATVSSGASEQGSGVVTYAVDLLIPNPDPNLRPGMTANVEIVTQDVLDTLIVPTAALTDAGNGQMYVTVVRGEDPASYSYEDVDVEVIAKNSTEAAVKGSLLSGDLVLLGMTGGEIGEEAVATDNVVVVGG